MQPLTASNDTINRALAFAEQCGKEPIVVADRAGFVVNALLFPYLNDAVHMLERGTAGMEAIDAAMCGGCGFPMGPFALLDLVGLDTSVAILEALHREFGDPRYVPAPALRRMVAEMPAGARLPTVRKLMRDHGVSQHLVQSALAQLRAEGAVASHVGRGTFVGARPGPAAAAATRSVLTLAYDSPYERSDVIASSLHRALIQKRYDSMTVTYHDHMQAIDMLRGGRRYDACVLQPRTSIIHASAW